VKITYKKHILEFKFVAGTSRGVLNTHTVYYVKIHDSENPILFGLGECAPLKGLSIDYLPDFEQILSKICTKLSAIDQLNFSNISEIIPENLPSIRFGFETALLDLKNGGKRQIFQNDFSLKNAPIEINGLIWMGDKALMLSRINEKINEGYKTLKLKIGAINFNEECELLDNIRANFSEKDLTIRVDANGAFSPNDAMKKLKMLSKYAIHSIEQPIATNQKIELKQIIKNSPIPIALDEELIGVFENEKEKLLEDLNPHLIVLKPTLLGGLKATKEWIEIAENQEISWWITSALESNIGLNAIAQFTAEFDNKLPQGLGTGQLYLNNIESPLEIKNGSLYFNQNMGWNLAFTS
jgi:o-succinylbenzoate synthase